MILHSVYNDTVMLTQDEVLEILTDDNEEEHFI